MAKLMSLLLAAFLTGSALAGGSGTEAQSGQTLAAGRYTAKMKALVCGACAKKITDTLRKFPGIQKVSVEEKASALVFSVMKGAKIDLAKLQASLKAASDEMGMGADYTLSGISKVGPGSAKGGKG